MVSYFAAAVARDADRWSASEVSLADAADVEDVADRLRDLSPSADVSLLFVESDDAYLVILRLDQGEDLRVFGSDSAFAEESRVGALLLGDVASPVADAELDQVPFGGAAPNHRPAAGAERAEGDLLVVEDEPADDAGDDMGDDLDDDDLAGQDDEAVITVAALGDFDPAGDADLLADLGVPARRLLGLCAQEGLLPSDITAELCQAIGCGDEVEELRE
jgi:putative tRNA adenosine deaminase-associated protein